MLEPEELLNLTQCCGVADTRMTDRWGEVLTCDEETMEVNTFQKCMADYEEWRHALENCEECQPDDIEDL